MAKLRIVRERVSSQGSEQNLRGFSGEPIFGHFWPRIVITQKGSYKNSQIEALLTAFHVHKVESAHKGFTHILTPNKPTETYKLDAINLFLLVLQLSAFENNTNCYVLWQANTFHTAMRTAIHEGVISNVPDIDKSFENKFQNYSHFLSIQAPVSLHLVQAGFQLIEANKELITFDRSQAHGCLRTEIAASKKILSKIDHV